MMTVWGAGCDWKAVFTKNIDKYRHSLPIAGARNPTLVLSAIPDVYCSTFYRVVREAGCQRPISTYAFVFEQTKEH